MYVHAFTQSVHAPMRGEAALDLVLSYGGDIDTDVAEGMFASDHLETCSRFHVKTPTIPRITRTSGFNYRAADFNQLRTALRCLPWFLLNDLDVDSATELFYDLLNAAIADCVPTVSRSRQPGPNSNLPPIPNTENTSSASSKIFLTILNASGPLSSLSNHPPNAQLALFTMVYPTLKPQTAPTSSTQHLDQSFPTPMLATFPRLPLSPLPR